jgi:membrane carboxypeptidase/penicillin-binding protein
VSGLGTEQLLHLELPIACRSGSAADDGMPVSGWLPRAVVAAEDQRFFEHPGYDLTEIAEALQRNQRTDRRPRGASTITQQLAKLVVAGDERSASRKLRELLYAVEMEHTLGKPRILQLYLDLAPWGNGICGAERAARVYLRKGASELGPVASAWLASLLTNPDAQLHQITATGQVDVERVGRIIDDMRPMSAARREKALATLPFWSPGIGPAPAVLAREARPPATAP